MIRKTIQRLEKAGFKENNIQQVALWLLRKVTGENDAELLNKSSLTHEEEQQLTILIEDLIVNQKPLQYILEKIPFCEMELFVEAPILIPRPETEEWLQSILKRYKNTPLTILDLCTGSGCIALACAKHLDAQVMGSDISSRAITLAEKNKQHIKVDAVEFVLSDLFENINSQFDIIISNPPYISEEEWKDLEPSVKNWEDKRALVAENKGLALIEKIIKEARSYFKEASESLLILEIGYSQAEAVCTFMRSYGYTDVEVLKDFSGHDRVVMGRYVAEKK